MVVYNDHLHGQCLIEVLSTKGSFAHVGLARDAVEAFELAKTQPPDVMLVDWHLPQGAALDLARWVAVQCPSVKVLLFGLTDTEQGEWARANARGAGYVLRTDTFDDLLTRIDQILRRDSSGQSVWESPGAPPQTGPRQPCDGDDRPGIESLTIREQQIVHLIEQGYSNKEIARSLKISLHTVKNHVHNVLAKLEVQSRHDAFGAACRRPGRPPS
jgi:two-component system nitrate/nitrite response regulator NarL